MTLHKQDLKDPTRCTVCNGDEDSLPVGCPERPLEPKEREAIKRGELDFFCGKWWVAVTNVRCERHKDHQVAQICCDCLKEYEDWIAKATKMLY